MGIVILLALGTSDRVLQARLGSGCLQMSVERGVVPGPSVTLGELLEPSQEDLGDLGGMIKKSWVAEKDTATKRPSGPCRAPAFHVLPGATLAVVQGPHGRGRVGKQEPGFGS